MIPLALLSGCSGESLTTGLSNSSGNLPYLTASCDRLGPLSNTATEGLLVDGGPVSRRSVIPLIASVDSLCNR